MNHLQLTPRVLTRSRSALLPRRYSTAQQPRPIPPPPQPTSKVLPTVLLLGGGGAAGLGAYYYYDPNADVFKQAKSILGLEPAPKSNAVSEKKKISKQDIEKKQAAEVKKPQVVRTDLPEKKVTQVPVQQTQKPAPVTPAKAAVATAAAVAAAATIPTNPPVPLPSLPQPPPPPPQKKEEEVGDTVSKQLLITALRAQQEALSESHECKIKVIQAEYDRRLSNASSVIEAERVVDLRAKYEKASAALQAIEQGIEARTTQNTRAKRLRALWAQVNALHARVNHPEYHDSTTTSIDKSRLIKSIEVPDKFVTQMVNSLPNSPVHSLESLKQRFYENVQPVAKSVTLIREGEKFSLWKYAVGKLFGGAVVEIKREAPDSSTTPSSSPVQSTSKALDTARCALERSDLLSAAIAVNQLRGLPRQVASDWLADARTLLETNQTLFVLMTYAASNNVF